MLEQLKEKWLKFWSLDAGEQLVNIFGNFAVPFTIGYLLHSALPVNSWRFWAIIVLVFVYRGTRGKNG
jgi:hypothetical protein